MFEKYLIVASKLDKAGTNITTALSQFRESPLLTSMKKNPSFDFNLIETEIVDDNGINLEKINKYDFIIFASKHQSEKGGKTLSVHAPGNWNQSDFGGKEKKICLSSAIFQKQLFENLKKNAEEYELNNYQVTLECTHHGPLIEKPCVFIEIGATPQEWEDRRAAFVVAKTISQTINSFRENPYNEVAVGIGGPHYCPSFTKIQLNSNIAISHIIPQYAFPISEEMILQAIKKTKEEVDFVLLDWKGCGVSEERQKIIDLLEKNYISWKRTSEIGK